MLFQPSRSSRKKPVPKNRTRPTLEVLEDRLVPSDLSEIPFVSPTGPTVLGINFDGENFYRPGTDQFIAQGGYLLGGYANPNGGFAPGSGKFDTNVDQNMQDILFRVSEMYAPFNVEVQRIPGANQWYGWRSGSTTVFVGTSYGSESIGTGSTPDEFMDYPHSHPPFGGGKDHLRNSDKYDFSFVPDSTAIPKVAKVIAHEAGHTFGLAHVRTDGYGVAGWDPGTIAGTIPDIMSYDKTRNQPLGYFANQELTLTEWDADGLTPDSLPNYQDFQPDKQASFYCLGQVLGYRPKDGNDTNFHVADVGTIDPLYQSTYAHPNFDDVTDTDSVFSVQGTITRLGDYDVFRWTAPQAETINFNLIGQNGLKPLLLVYDASGPNAGQLQWQNGGNRPASATDIVTADTGNQLEYIQDSYGARNRPNLNYLTQQGDLAVNGGQSYYFVLGAQDSDSIGTYQLQVNQLPSFATLTGTQLFINGNKLGAKATETLDIDTDPGRRIIVALNGQQAQFEPGQVSSITVNSLGGNNTINVESLPQSVSLKLNLSKSDAVNFSPHPKWLFASRNLDLIQGKVSINGKPSSLDISLFDNDALGNRTIGVEANALSLPDGNIISNQARLSSITLWEATAANTVSQVNVAPTSMNLSSLGGANLTVHGTAALTLNDQANPDSSVRHTITAGKITSEYYGSVYTPKTGKLSWGWITFATVDYHSLAALNVNLGNHANEVNVEPLSPPTQIVAGTGSNVINVSPSTHNVAWVGQLSVSGAGNTTLNLYDQADTSGWYSPNDWSFQDQSGRQLVTRSFTLSGESPEVVFSVAYSHVNSANLYAAQSPNLMSVEALDCATTIYAGTSSDVITLMAPKELKISHGPTIGPPKNVWHVHQPDLTVNGGRLAIDTGLLLPKVPFNTVTYSLTDSVTSSAVVLNDTVKDVFDALASWKATHSPFERYKGLPVITATIYYSQQINYSNLKHLYLNAGPEATTVLIGDKGSVRNLSVPLTVHGRGANTSVVVDDSKSTLVDHLTIANGNSDDVQVGMKAGDQFFAAGGGLDCTGIGSLMVNLSKAADDVVHLSPSAVTAFFINGDPSEYQAGVGAELDILLGGITGAVAPGAPGAGTWTFSHNSHKPITFTNVKKTQAK
jgi:hypothetical protein